VKRSVADRVLVGDHVVFGEDLSSYADPSIGGITGGRQPTGLTATGLSR
jgi:hypothetical protein